MTNPYLEDLSNDELAEMLAALKETAAHTRRSIGEVEMELIRRGKEAGAVLIPTPNFIVSLETTKSYAWDAARFRTDCSKFFSPADLDRIITTEKPAPPATKIDTRRVLALAKKLGPSVEAEVLKCCTITESDPKIKLEAVAEEDKPL